MLGKFVLWFSAAMFIGYGIVCLISPTTATDYAGLALVTGDGLPEAGAMYGGLQTGFGIF